MKPSNCLKTNTDSHNKILLLPNNTNLDIENFKFINTKHLGMTAVDGKSTKFFHIEKHLGEKNRSVFINGDDLFDGAVHIFKEINPFFVLLTREFLEFRVPDKKWMDKNVEKSENDDSSSTSIIEKYLKNDSEDKNIQKRNKFSEISDDNFGFQGFYPFDNYDFLNKISENETNKILQFKEIDIGEDLPLKVLKFDLKMFTNFVQQKLEKIQKNTILVSNFAHQPKREAWLILREFLPRKSWAFLEFELKIPVDELEKVHSSAKILSINDEIQQNKENLSMDEPESKKVKIEGKAEKSLKKCKVKSKNIMSMFAAAGKKKAK